MKIKATKSVEIEVEADIPGFYNFGSSFLFLKDEELNGIELNQIASTTRTDIHTGKVHIDSIALFVKHGKPCTSEEFRDALLDALDEVKDMCPNQFIENPGNYARSIGFMVTPITA